jgi:ribonuclease HI
MSGEYKYTGKLKVKAEQFITKLESAGLTARIEQDSFREYSVKIEVDECGFTTLYYKPTKNTFSVSNHEIRNKEIADSIDKLWDPAHIEKNEIYVNKGIEIDVDGSYSAGITSYAAVMRKNGKVIHELSGIVKAGEVEGSHQVAGEIRAVIEAVNWCEEKKIKSVIIYYDYLGLEMWACGKWKAKKNLTKEYSAFMKARPLKIEWVKVDSHTGVKWNEYADKLAKKALIP